MEACQQDFNACVNFLMSSKVCDPQHIKNGGPRNVHSPWPRDYLRLLPHCLGQILVWCENSIVFVISQVEVTNLKH
jgi:hypothetical protein